MATQPRHPETIPAFVREFLDELADIIADCILEENAIVGVEPSVSTEGTRC
jgi:hypothetical protein